ncbi:hypothetical protein BB560_005958 [Smittium megazygosporum]|uniref:AdoMet activation domain-containing protein n=1 Tax=Smittium megazygosporum TaxID=133381 RepID=A0A2T9YP59_9FUNG|nr:hypothetical protein BB560_005958 [Smittium megazygosporum]
MPCVPNSTGIKVMKNIDIMTAYNYIDWSPFFSVFQLRGKYPNRGYPKLFNDPDMGAEAKKLFDEAQEMIKVISKTDGILGTAIFGIFPANSSGNDILVYTDETRTKVATVFKGIRQQEERYGETDGHFVCMSDFIAPVGSGIKDYIGGIVVTSGMGVQKLAEKFKEQNDDYSAILTQALGDRFAEALTEKVHSEIRRDYWGYEKGDMPPVTELHKLKYDGIRPAPGYPSQPDHSEMRKLYDLLNLDEHPEINLTENYMITPAHSVSALIFGHPKSKYFATGKIGKDQVIDYASRSDEPFEVVEKNLKPVLSYDS